MLITIVKNIQKLGYVLKVRSSFEIDFLYVVLHLCNW